MKPAESAAEKLLRHGIKPSVQRLAIADYIASHFTHPTADDIYSALHPNMPTLSKTTVYNTVKLLVEAGVIAELNIDNKNTRYDAAMNPHAHFRCRCCGKIIDLMDCKLPQFPHGLFMVDEVSLSFSGYCNECREIYPK